MQNSLSKAFHAGFGLTVVIGLVFCPAIGTAQEPPDEPTPVQQPAASYPALVPTPAVSKPSYCDWESLCDPSCGAECGDCTGQPWCGIDWFAPGRWQFALDVLALKRDQASEVEFAGGHGRTLATDTSDSPFWAMPRILGAFAFTPTWRVEGLYFGLGQWKEDRAIRDDTPNVLGGEGDLLSRLTNFGNAATPGIDYNNFASFATESTFDNVELNLRHRFVTPPYMAFAGLVGLRYLDIGEDVQFRTVSAVPGPFDATNDVDTATSNKLFGFQIGGDAYVQIENRWSAQFEAKAAVCENRADVRTRYINSDSAGAVTVFDTSDTASKTVFIGDLALTLNCQWTPNVATRFGYHALWIDGLALATQNVERDVDLLRLGPANLDTDGRTVYHGPQAGLTLSW